MHAQAQLPGELAVGEEIQRVHTQGEHIGTFFVSGPHLLDHTAYLQTIEGTDHRDFTLYYLAAVEALMQQDERVKLGHAFRISIC